ncbi:MAG: LysR family transcriptional regulator [Mogibacterium sp.]|nr:LysR family transcriptional regulator [Mogibacterium sp.]
MDNTKFKAFIECINKGSVTAAAEELGYTPSAVSQLISSLEKELGLKLLNRTQRGVSLTSEGSELVPAVRAWMAAEDEVYQLASELKGISTGTLTIASYPSAAITWLPRIIRRFKNDYPGIDINIVENIRSDIFEHLENNEADMAILVYSEPMPYEWISLADVEMLAAVPEDNPYANAEAFPIKEIENYDFIMGSWGNEREIIEILDKHGVKPNVRYTTYDTPLTVALVRMGLGISMVNALGSQYWIGNYARLPLEPREFINFGIAIPSRDRLSKAAEKFLSYAVEEFKNKEGIEYTDNDRI